MARFSETANFRQLHGCLVGNNEEARRAIDSPEFQEAFSQLMESKLSWSEVEPQLTNLSPLQKEGLKLMFRE